VVCPLGDAGITCQVIDVSMISQMKALEAENRRLKGLREYETVRGTVAPENAC